MPVSIDNRSLKLKPFVKWAGGKGRLLSQLDANLPQFLYTSNEVCYIEPFVGGGAMLFHMMQEFTNITKIVINDINEELIACYRLIKDNPENLVSKLKGIEDRFLSENQEVRRELFYAYRNEYNNKVNLADINRCALFIFLNRTCFNGLHRVNLKGDFNVPYGRYANPTICDKDTILAISKALNRIDITIKSGNYRNVLEDITNPANTFVYLDPPYRPLLGENNFRAYSKGPFSDQQQEELKAFCDELTGLGARWMQSNSDSKNEDGSSYFEDLYDNYIFQTIYAPRAINAFGEGRGKISESLIKNY
jgi:DNA adenine methylase